MSTITLTNAALTGGTATFDISVEAETLVELTVNPKAYQSVTRLKLLYAAAITQVKLIPATEPAGNANDVVLDLIASMKDAVALAEASTDF